MEGISLWQTTALIRWIMWEENIIFHWNSRYCSLVEAGNTTHWFDLWSKILWSCWLCFPREFTLSAYCAVLFIWNISVLWNFSSFIGFFSAIYVTSVSRGVPIYGRFLCNFLQNICLVYYAISLIRRNEKGWDRTECIRTKSRKLNWKKKLKTSMKILHYWG